MNKYSQIKSINHPISVLALITKRKQGGSRQNNTEAENPNVLKAGLGMDGGWYKI